MAYNIKQPKKTWQKPREEGYQGWSNFVTWQIALNIDNEQYLQEETFRVINEGQVQNGYELKNWFKEELESGGNYNEDYNAYKLSDAWTDRKLEEADWNELYESYKDSIKENEEYEKEKKEKQLTHSTRIVEK